MAAAIVAGHHELGPGRPSVGYCEQGHLPALDRLWVDTYTHAGWWEVSGASFERPPTG